MQQPSLFGADAAAPPDVSARPDAAGRLAQEHASARDLAARLPPLLKCGTSSWSFPGWAGIVYGREATQAHLSRHGLAEYARHPLLTTVGIDRSYYAPIPVDDLRAYAGQLPPRFPCCAKAPASVTSLVVPGGRRDAPEPNPHFLSPERFAVEMLEPFAVAFAERLDRFLAPLPREWQFAVELRDPRLLTAEYARVLERHRAGHVYNAWSAMPTPGAQAQTLDPARLAFVVVRLLLKPGTWYEDARDAFKPFNRLVEPDAGMRDEVTDIVVRAVARAQPAWLLVNNKAEGSAPLTIRALAERIAADTGNTPGRVE